MRSHVDGNCFADFFSKLVYVLSIAVAGLLPSASVNASGLALQDLVKMDLRSLMGIDISLASRNEENQFTVPAAAYVLTQEDIRRSGLRRLPEILRLIPGMHVAKIDTNKWEISMRNLQSRFNSTMLVMIDGRHVYTPFFAGVNWEMQDVFLDDIDHIEVVRGPGGSLWGANAVDGVVNIITKHAENTRGVHAYGAVGEGEMDSDFGVRAGGETVHGTHYRVFAKRYDTDSGEYLDGHVSTNTGLAPPGEDGNDHGESTLIGFRMDWSQGADQVMIQGNALTSEFNEDRKVANMISPNLIKGENLNLLMRWKRDTDSGNSFSLTSYYDRVGRDDDILNIDEDTFDMDFQHRITFNEHDLTWGLGYRHYKNKALISFPLSCDFTSPCFGVDPEKRTLTTSSAFFQSRFALGPRNTLILGSKFEDNDFTGFEYQPTIRTLWTPDASTTLWAAITRAVRTPNRTGTDSILDFGSGLIVPVGNRNLDSYVTHTYEAGYRKQFSDAWYLDLALFSSDYRNTLQANDSVGIDKVHGFETFAKYHHSDDLRLEFGLIVHKGRVSRASGGGFDMKDLPETSAYARVQYDLRHDMELDGSIHFVDESEIINTASTIPSYTRVDLRYAWQVNKQFGLSLVATNLLDQVHPEEQDATKINTGVPRGVLLMLTYKLQQ